MYLLLSKLKALPRIESLGDNGKRNPFANKVHSTFIKIIRNLSPPYPPKSAFLDNMRHGPNNKNLEIPNDADRIDDEKVIINKYIVPVSPPTITSRLYNNKNSKI